MSEPHLTASSPLTLLEAATLVGSYKWLEMRLFEAFGGAISVVTEPHLKALVGTQCYHHAWHAEVWQKRLPELREIDVETLTKPANAGSEALLNEVLGSTDSLELFTGVFRVVLPRKIAAYIAHLERCSPIADGPTIRSLNQVLTDEVADWQAGERALQTVLKTPADVARAAAHQARLEALIVANGMVAFPSGPN